MDSKYSYNNVDYIIDPEVVYVAEVLFYIKCNTVDCVEGYKYPVDYYAKRLNRDKDKAYETIGDLVRSCDIMLSRKMIKMIFYFVLGILGVSIVSMIAILYSVGV